MPATAPGADDAGTRTGSPSNATPRERRAGAWLIETGWTLLAGVLALVAGCGVLRVWNYDLHRPLAYGGDSVSSLMFVKGIVDNGWVQVNPWLGAPGRLEMYDYPLGGDNVNFAIMKVMAMFTDQAAVVLNGFYLLTFVLIGITSFLVMRRLDIDVPFALLGAVLVAITPYHFSRYVSHLLLSAYYMLPIGMYLAIRLYQGRGLARRDGSRLPWIRNAALVAACLVLGATGVYYAVFTCVAVVLLGALGAIRHRSWGVVLASALVVALIGGSVIVNQASTILHTRAEGKNAQVGQRQPNEAEIYGLNITQLLLPVPGHRIDGFDHARTRYITTSSEVTGESMSPIGSTATIGFFAVLVVLAVVSAMPALEPRRRWLDAAVAISLIVVGFVLIATTGGLGTLFNYAVNPSIRAWGRMTVALAFLCTVMTMLLVSTAVRSPRVERRLGWLRIGRVALAAPLAALLLAVGAWADQASPSYQVDPSWKPIWDADEAMGRDTERALPSGAMVYQLPYVAFPESPPHPGQDGSYDNARPYLHTTRIHWSFAAMRGRSDDIGPQLDPLPPAQLVERLRDLEFDAVWIDRRAYADRPAFEQELGQLLGAPVVEGAVDNRFAIYRL